MDSSVFVALLYNFSLGWHGGCWKNKKAVFGRVTRQRLCRVGWNRHCPPMAHGDVAQDLGRAHPTFRISVGLGGFASLSLPL